MPKCDFCGKEAFVAGWLCQSEAQAGGCKTEAKPREHEMTDINRQPVLDHGYVLLRNIAGPVRRADAEFDADDTDPANAARFSFDAADKIDRTREQDLKLARYLMEHRHSTPFEMVTVWLEMQMPIFVARQFVRHRTVSINEVSARYTKLEPLFYVPDPAVVGVKSETNKQGRTIDGDAREVADQFASDLRSSNFGAYRKYDYAIAAGIPNELARLFLPLNVYTKWLWKQDLHNLLHFLDLRLDPHAQYEARQYAEAVAALLRRVLPHSMALFDQRRLARDVER